MFDNKEKGINGILFDLEGTLVESGYQKNPKKLEELHIETKKLLLNIGVPVNIIKNYDKSTYLRNNSYVWAKKNLNPDQFLKFHNHIEKFMYGYDMFSVKKSSLYPDTIITLEFLIKKNYKIGIITNTSKHAAHHILHKTNIINYFHTIITRDDVYRIKPNPEMVKIALRKIQCNVEWFIGDSRVDVEAAEKACLKSILIKRDGSKPKYYVDYLIHNLTDLIKIL